MSSLLGHDTKNCNPISLNIPNEFSNFTEDHGFYPKVYGSYFAAVWQMCLINMTSACCCASISHNCMLLHAHALVNLFLASFCDLCFSCGIVQRNVIFSLCSLHNTSLFSVRCLLTAKNLDNNKAIQKSKIEGHCIMQV